MANDCQLVARGRGAGGGAVGEAATLGSSTRGNAKNGEPLIQRGGLYDDVFACVHPRRKMQREKVTCDFETRSHDQ